MIFEGVILGVGRVVCVFMVGGVVFGVGRLYFCRGVVGFFVVGFGFIILWRIFVDLVIVLILGGYLIICFLMFEC